MCICVCVCVHLCLVLWCVAHVGSSSYALCHGQNQSGCEWAATDAREQVEAQVTSDRALFRTLGSSLIWMEFISIVTSLAFYFCVLQAPTIEVSLCIISVVSLRVPLFGVYLIPREWTYKTLSDELWVICSYSSLTLRAALNKNSTWPFSWFPAWWYSSPHQSYPSR